MSTCTGCGAEITWAWVEGPNMRRPVPRYEHVCPACARESKAGYPLEPKRIAAEIDGQAALYGGEDECHD